MSSRAANTFHCVWNFEDFTTAALGTRQVTIQTIARYGVNTNTAALITGDLRNYRTTTNTSLTVSNLVNGRSYRVSFYGPLTPWGTNLVTVITNSFDESVTGLVDAIEYLSAPLNTDASTVAYSQTAADARFHNVSGDTSTNATFRGTVTFPATSVNGYVWTATNASGAGFWAAASAASQSPWSTEINGAQHALTNASALTAGSLTATGQVSATTLALTGAETNSSITSAIIGATSSGKRVGAALSGLTWDGTTLTASGGGLGSTITNFTAKGGTTAAAVALVPTNMPSTPTGGFLAQEITPPYSPGAWFNGKWRDVAYLGTNSYGATNMNVIRARGYNFGGNSAGSSTYGSTDTNQPSWMEQVESGWQNASTPSNIQLEYWLGWGTPRTIWGTNMEWRPFGLNLVWNHADKTYQSSDGNFTLGSFDFINPRGSGVYGARFSAASTSSDSFNLYLKGSLYVQPNDQSYGSVELPGGNLLLQPKSGYAGPSVFIGVDWTNALGSGKPNFVIGPNAPAAASGIFGTAGASFTNWIMWSNFVVHGSVTADSFSGDGSALTALNGTQVTSGTVADARIASTITRNTQISDTAWAASWNGVTSDTATKNAVYDWGHLHDADDDGKVDVLDQSTGIANTDSSGALQTPITTSAGLFGALSDETGSGSGALAMFNIGPYVHNGTTGPGYIDFREDADNGSNRARVIAPSSIGDIDITLPNASSTLPIFGQQITFSGPTAARTVTLPDANFTAARTDAGQTFTGTQVMTADLTSSSVAVTAAAGDNDTSPATTAFTTTAKQDATNGLYSVLNSVKDEIWIPASSMNPAGTGPAAATNSWATTTDGQKIEAWDFDSATTEAVQFTLTLPSSWDAGTVKAKYFWKAVNATGLAAVWSIAGGSLNDAETGGNTLGTAVTLTNTTGSTSNVLNISAATAAVTIGGSPSAGHLCWFEVSRVGGASGDTLTNDARLVGVQLQYTRAASATAW